jgi:ribosomal protein S18 acetylase RimI-like enzyme
MAASGDHARRRSLAPHNLIYRSLGPDDAGHVRWALYEAVAWNPERELPPYDALIEHPEMARYHRDWGRPGDQGVLVEVAGARAGVAFYRLFSDADHGHGYVDETTPELAVAVEPALRGRGIGSRLMTELAKGAKQAGFTRLSLSVDTENPALQLYGRLGFREIARDEGGVRMILELWPRT